MSVQTACRPMGVNWIGLWTIIRREVSRMMRVPIQAFVAPWISALLFIFIFGFVVGGRIAHDRRPPLSRVRAARRADDEHRQRRLPAIDLADLFPRFLRFIEETLVAPLSYVEMIVGHRSPCVVVRSVVTAHRHPADRRRASAPRRIAILAEFLFWIVAVSIIFGLLGIIIGLWAKNFEQLNMLIVFFITPLSMVGGVFNTINMLPPWLRWLAYGQSVLLFHQRPAPRDDRLPRRSAG